ncbi:unnamed protein product [Moneuplotes crassus]|uniref:C2H2-type domain-containing protein n=1 Tax=Euplotes crassus TaxID=5936 RepID=A0AAD1Y9V0_EUPCR|nr:unnamed protein product [Moneuplotes crassus]
MTTSPGTYPGISMFTGQEPTLHPLNTVARSLGNLQDLQSLLSGYCVCDMQLQTGMAQPEQWGIPQQYIHPGLDSKRLEENRVDPKILSLYSNIKDNKSKTVSAKADKVFMCSFGNCRKVFYKKWNFSLHMKMHYKIKQFKCQACGKEFTQKCNYNKHMKTHSRP